MRIGIDLMGSESFPAVLFEAVLNAASQFSESDSLVVFASHAALQDVLGDRRFQPFLEGSPADVAIHLVSEEVLMADDPLAAVRMKKDSSLVVGIRQLKEGKIDAFVSAGNTGALVACAALLLPKLWLERCCLLATLPTKGGPLAILDVGGFLSPSPEILLQYAQVGAAYQRILLGKKCPYVGLMNIGVESKKGTLGVRTAYQLLEEQECERLHFVGNVEGREAFQGGIDVLVTDGFTGNVFLKASQGVSTFIFDDLKASLKEALDEEALQIIDTLYRRFCYDEHPGALLCGVEGIVIKCHGATTARGMFQSILGAKRLAEAGLIEKMKKELLG